MSRAVVPTVIDVSNLKIQSESGMSLLWFK